MWTTTPREVVFDCDGLLMDTEPCWTVAETELFARRGLPFGPAQKALVIGKSGAAMAEAFGEPGAGDALAAGLLEHVAEVVAAKAEALPGARELVDLVADRVPFAVASNPRALLCTALARGGFTVEVSVAADEVVAPKPAPDLYLAACAALDVAPGEAVAFEDSMTGVRPARAAGVPAGFAVEVGIDSVDLC